MRVGILAGGKGSRLLEETQYLPKPMIRIGSKPILWHIMKHYSFYGFKEFVLALGYKGNEIRQYFSKKPGDESEERTLSPLEENAWNVQLIETGEKTPTGGRVRRLTKYLGDQTFMLTYGDGLSDLNIPRLIEFHQSHGKLATVAAVRPPSRYGRLNLKGHQVVNFQEKPREDVWINGGFFILEPGVMDYIQEDDVAWEREPLENLAREGQLMAYQHDSFWQAMDTLPDKKDVPGKGTL